MILLLLSTFFVFAGEQIQKYAFIIAVSDYPEDSGIANLSSDEDERVLRQTLIGMGFAENNILSVGGQQATRRGILEKWSELNKKITPGSFVHIHYSGHGSQVPDDNGDEREDNLDEVWVTYDTKYFPKEKKLDAKTVIIDDEIEKQTQKTRQILGPEGQVLFTTDSCHNASITRSIGKTRYLRTDYSTATNTASFTPTTPKDLAPMIEISASDSNQVAYEVKDGDRQMGSLTYALSKVLPNAKSTTTYREMFHQILLLIQRKKPSQQPKFNGEIDALIFKNGNHAPPPHIMIRKQPIGYEVDIDGGRHLGLAKGAIVKIHESAKFYNGDLEGFTTGTVTETVDDISTVELEERLEPEQLYVATVSYRNFLPQGTRIFYEDDIPYEQEKELDAMVDEYQFLEQEYSRESADIAIGYDQKWFIVDLHQPAKSKHDLQSDTLHGLRPKMQLVSTQQYLHDLATQYIDTSKFDVELYEVTNPKIVSEKCIRSEKKLAKDQQSQVYRLNHGQFFNIRFHNKTDEPIWVTTIHLVTSKETVQLNPDSRNSFVKVPANSPKDFNSCWLPVNEAEEVNQLLFIASKQKGIDFSPLNSTPPQAQKRQEDIDSLVLNVMMGLQNRKGQSSHFKGYGMIHILKTNMEEK